MIERSVGRFSPREALRSQVSPKAPEGGWIARPTTIQVRVFGYTCQTVDKMIEIRYAGVVVGRSSVVRGLDTRGLFLGVTEPLPVGTLVSLKIDDHVVPGRVETVTESQELTRAGMRVRFADPASANLFGSPSEAPPEVVPAVTPAIVENVAHADAGVPDAPQPLSPSGHRRIVVDASSEKAEADAMPASDASDDVRETSGPIPAEDGRIPAPDPSAFAGAGPGKKNRRNKRR